jgi:rhodanese-related sulfurtransferase
MLDIDPDRVVVVVCQQGYSSSLAAHRLQQVGLSRATDLIGGFAALSALRTAAGTKGIAPQDT